MQQIKEQGKNPPDQTNEEERRMELEESGSLTSDYITKVHESKQYGTGTKTDA